jgi:hypothetical protein
MPRHFVQATTASSSASRAARAGSCGEALDDYTVAVAAHHAGMVVAAGAVYRDQALSRSSQASWRALQTAKLAIRDLCLINRIGHGLQGASSRRSPASR